MANLWLLYPDSESLQWAVDRWPKDKKIERFMDMLFSESTEVVQIVDDKSVDREKPITFRVQGRCHGNVSCEFYYVLYGKDLTVPQKEKLRSFTKVLYAYEKNRGYPMYRRMCRALGVTFK